ncbi:hypothetical protein F0562_007565 [Nyssa sinensis]|uniref:Protein kinase domain-containing protein n=1 Tax=Nyssa sinensis TaxID=561372 RepID=A0A5J5A5H2_9ASTE|nr:hypothetical protein F0562_007565 [Nyssa sinensis]
MWKRGRRLGRGSYGVVSLVESNHEGGGFDHHLPSVMAVKSAEISKAHSIQKEKELLQRFEGCPYIISCFGDDFTIEDGVELYNILLEFASGGSLADRIRERSGDQGLNEYEVRRYTHSVLKGLSYIHMHGYVHCDIKPHNILLVGDWSSTSSLIPRLKRDEEIAKIADFGLAKKVVGNGKKKGQRGKPPWKCGPNSEICNLLFRISFTEELPEIPKKGVSKEAEDFLKKCLVRDPKSRWTAHMLLDHPFVSSIEERYGICKKRKRREDIDEEQQQASISGSETTFGMQHVYQRYWGKKRILAMSYSGEAIPLGLL